jgi:TonB family protein
MNQSRRFATGLLLASAVTVLSSRPAHAQKLQRPEALRLDSKQIAQLKMKRGDTAEQHYPAAAKRDAVDGVVSVDLLLNVEGQVQEAQIVSESPSGFGFGLAALDTAKTFEFVNTYKRPVLLSWDFAFLP